MKNIPTFREIFHSYKWESFQFSILLTFVIFMFFFSIGIERYSYDINSLLKDLMVRSEILLLFIFFGIFLIWNYLVSIFGIFLLITSYILSKRYVRFLMVLLGIIFFLTFFHVIPVPEIDKSYGFINEILMRIVQGYGMVATCVFFFGLIQCLVLFIIGREDSK